MKCVGSRDDVRTEVRQGPARTTTHAWALRVVQATGSKDRRERGDGAIGLGAEFVKIDEAKVSFLCQQVRVGLDPVGQPEIAVHRPVSCFETRTGRKIDRLQAGTKFMVAEIVHVASRER